MAHGTYDSVIPLLHVIALKEKLLAAKYVPEWHEYPIGHTVSPQEIADLTRWLQRIIHKPD